MPASKNALAVGPRVYLRRPAPADAAAFTAGARLSDRLHRGWVRAPSTRAGFTAYLRRFAGKKSRDARSATHVGVVVCKLADDVLLGVFNFSEIVRGAFKSSYLGYYAFAPHAGQGYMSEGLHLALAFAFGKLKLHRIEANVQPTNRPSVSLVRRAGFTREGFSRRYVKIAGRWRDHERWAMLAEDWRRLRRGRRRAPLPFALAAALGIAGCATAPERLDVPKVVAALELSPYAVHEECVELKAGERIGYLFRAAVPVAFNIHLHEGNAVIEPIATERAAGESGEFVADRDQTYCLMWEAGAGGSSLAYRVARLRR